MFSHYHNIKFSEIICLIIVILCLCITCFYYGIDNVSTSVLPGTYDNWSPGLTPGSVYSDTASSFFDDAFGQAQYRITMIWSYCAGIYDQLVSSSTVLNNLYNYLYNDLRVVLNNFNNNIFPTMNSYLSIISNNIQKLNTIDSKLNSIDINTSTLDYHLSNINNNLKYNDGTDTYSAAHSLYNIDRNTSIIEDGLYYNKPSLVQKNITFYTQNRTVFSYPVNSGYSVLQYFRPLIETRYIDENNHIRIYFPVSDIGSSVSFYTGTFSATLVAGNTISDLDNVLNQQFSGYVTYDENTNTYIYDLTFVEDYKNRFYYISTSLARMYTGDATFIYGHTPYVMQDSTVQVPYLQDINNKLDNISFSDQNIVDAINDLELINHGDEKIDVTLSAADTLQTTSLIARIRNLLSTGVSISQFGDVIDDDSLLGWFTQENLDIINQVNNGYVELTY